MQASAVATLSISAGLPGYGTAAATLFEPVAPRLRLPDEKVGAVSVRVTVPVSIIHCGDDA